MMEVKGSQGIVFVQEVVTVVKYDNFNFILASTFIVCAQKVPKMLRSFPM